MFAAAAAAAVAFVAVVSANFAETHKRKREERGTEKGSKEERWREEVEMCTVCLAPSFSSSYSLFAFHVT